MGVITHTNNNSNKNDNDIKYNNDITKINSKQVSGSAYTDINIDNSNKDEVIDIVGKQKLVNRESANKGQKSLKKNTNKQLNKEKERLLQVVNTMPDSVKEINPYIVCCISMPILTIDKAYIVFFINIFFPGLGTILISYLSENTNKIYWFLIGNIS